MGLAFCDDILLSCGADGTLKRRHLPSLLATHQNPEDQVEPEDC